MYGINLIFLQSRDKICEDVVVEEVDTILHVTTVTTTTDGIDKIEITTIDLIEETIIIGGHDKNNQNL